MILSQGKEQQVAKRGTIRIEDDNDRIVYTYDGVIRRIDTFLNSTFFNEAGDKSLSIGITSDGKFAYSVFDPATGNEIRRDGILPNDIAGTATVKEGINLPDAF